MSPTSTCLNSEFNPFVTTSRGYKYDLCWWVWGRVGRNWCTCASRCKCPTVTRSVHRLPAIHSRQHDVPRNSSFARYVLDHSSCRGESVWRWSPHPNNSDSADHWWIHYKYLSQWIYPAHYTTLIPWSLQVDRDVVTLSRSVHRFPRFAIALPPLLHDRWPFVLWACAMMDNSCGRAWEYVWHIFGDILCWL